MNKRILAGAITLLGVIAIASIVRMNPGKSPVAPVESTLKPATERPSEDTAAPVTQHAGSETPSRTVAPVPDQAREEIRRCLGERADHAGRDLGQVVASITDQIADPKARTLAVRNVHFRLPNGEKRRIHLFADSGADGKPVQRLRFFAEDSEGLPVPLEIPSEHQVNPSESTLQGYLGAGSIEFTQEKRRAQLPEGATLEWTEENGKVTEFHMQDGNRNLGCTTEPAVSCRCQR